MSAIALEKITRRQEQILLLIYKYRYLNRIQIQTFLGHKDKQPINAWLRDLKNKNYLYWDYQQTREDISKPAIYCSGLGAIRYFKTKTYSHPSVISRLYRDANHTREFIDRCVLTADIAIAIGQQLEWGKYETITPSMCVDTESEFYFLNYYGITPDLILIQRVPGKAAEANVYFVMQPTTPIFRIRFIIDMMADMLYNGYWVHNVKSHWPEVTIIFATKRQKFHAWRYLRRAFKGRKSPFTLMMAEDVKRTVTS